MRHFLRIHPETFEDLALLAQASALNSWMRNPANSMIEASWLTRLQKEPKSLFTNVFGIQHEPFRIEPRGSFAHSL